MQASSAWTPPTGTLAGILQEARVRLGELRRRASILEAEAAAADTAPSLQASLRGRDVAIIAEVKRRSPSKGWIRAELSAADQAAAYCRGGASAISVLTEPAHFGGSVEDLSAVRQAVRLPVLKKDFHIDPIQLVEARAIGASAALLIARALEPGALRDMLDEARRLTLEVLVEVRDEWELERALSSGAGIIGVNNRNLETLAMDPSKSERLLPLIPEDVVAIAESGVTGRSDIERLASVGAHAVLVGSIVSGASDPTAAVRELSGVSRAARGH